MMVSKNASPTGAWLIIAILTRGVPGACPPPPPLFAFESAAGLPPVLHAAVAMSKATAGRATSPLLRSLNMVSLSLAAAACAGLGPYGGRSDDAGGCGWHVLVSGDGSQPRQ